jgi:hypothetical protein
LKACFDLLLLSTSCAGSPSNHHHCFPPAVFLSCIQGARYTFG